jgi:hypothetical protein
MFNYEKAFSRNIGSVTEQEQQILRGKKVATAGGVGVDGGHLLTLARLGVENFTSLILITLKYITSIANQVLLCQR